MEGYSQRSTISKQVRSAHRRQSGVKRKILQIRECVSILYMLTAAPAKPLPQTTHLTHTSVCAITSAPSLSFGEEKKLVEDLVFLASTTTDSRKVRAICLERVISHNHIKFRINIAANHGELGILKTGLEDVIALLRQIPLEEDVQRLLSTTAAKSKTSNLEFDALLQRITILNFNRIMCRLRSRHARWEGNFKKERAARRPLPTRLLEVWDLMRQRPATTDTFACDIEALKRLFSSLESKPSTEIVATSSVIVDTVTNIVNAIFRLWRNPYCSIAISNEHLMRSLAKIANYITVAMSLINFSRRHPWAISLEVNPVRMNVMTLPELTKSPGSFQNSASQQPIAQNVVQQLPRRVRPFKNDHGELLLSDQTFVDLVNIKCAVHAEIQLLFHAELSAPPRTATSHSIDEVTVLSLCIILCNSWTSPCS